MLNTFRFRMIPLFVTLALCMLGLTLGQWQTRRAIEKETIASSMFARGEMHTLNTFEVSADPQQLVFRRASLTGQFVDAWPLYLDNRPMNGVAGFYVLMPFKIAVSGQHVLVVRGWQPRNPANRTQIPVLKTPKGVVKLEGVVRTGVDKVMQLGVRDPLKAGAFLQNIEVLELSREMGLTMPNLVLYQTNESFDGLKREWTLPSTGADKHRAYAFQWYALSLMAVIFFVVTGFRRGKKEQ